MDAYTPLEKMWFLHLVPKNNGTIFGYDRYFFLLNIGNQKTVVKYPLLYMEDVELLHIALIFSRETLGQVNQIT